MNLIRPLTIFLIGIVMSLGGTWAFAKEGDKPLPSPEAKATAPESTNTLSYSLRLAVTRFMDKDLNGAAEQLRAAATILEADARQAQTEVSKDLDRSARELRGLAADVEKGLVQSREKLDQMSTRAYWAESKDNYTKAMNAWTDKKTAEAGRQLDLAADNLEKSWERSGRIMDEPTQDAIAEARVVADRVKKGADGAKKDLGKRLSELGQQIDRFGKSLEPVKSEEKKTETTPPQRGSTAPKEKGGLELCLWQPGAVAGQPDGPAPGNGVPLTFFSVVCTGP